MNAIITVGVAFFAFSLFASTIYIWNDYKDIEKDRQHPKKKFRPMAAGEIKASTGLVVMGISFSLAVFISLILLNYQFLILALGYLVLNFFYSIKLKQIPILDISVVSVGYVIRVFAGALVVSIEPSAWIIVMTFLLALFIALAKRRDDVLLFEESGTKLRAAIDGYNTQFLNSAMAIMASVVIVAYLMYSISEDVVNRFGDKLYISVIFVILGILRYLQVSLVEKNSGSPTDLVYEDRFLQVVVLGWIVSVILIIYWF